MITKVKSAGAYGPRRNYFSQPDDGMITQRQQRIITDLIFTNMFEDDRERMLQQLPDMTSAEANDMIFEIESANWR